MIIMFIAADIESLNTNVPIIETIDSIIDLCIQLNIDTNSISVNYFCKVLSLALCDNYIMYTDQSWPWVNAIDPWPMWSINVWPMNQTHDPWDPLHFI